MSISNFHILRFFQTQSMSIGGNEFRNSLTVSFIIYSSDLLKPSENCASTSWIKSEKNGTLWNIFGHLRSSSAIFGHPTNSALSIELIFGNPPSSTKRAFSVTVTTSGKSNFVEHPISRSPTRALSKHALNILGNATSNRTSFKKSVFGIRLIRQIEQSSSLTCESPGNWKKNRVFP